MKRIQHGGLVLDSLGTENVNYDDVIDFIIHTVYNRPAKEKIPAQTRKATLTVGKGKKRKYRSTNLVLPDKSSLIMKIKRSNLVADPWRNCLGKNLVPLIPKENGLDEVDGELVTKWFEWDQLPSDEEYDAHINKQGGATGKYTDTMLQLPRWWSPAPCGFNSYHFLVITVENFGHFHNGSHF